MNVVDSSGWLAFFADSKNAKKFAPALQETEQLLVPTIIMYEVCKVLLREKGEEAAIIGQAYLQQGIIIQLTSELAVQAAQKSLEYRLPMADSIILAAAHAYDARLWTQDEHFKGMRGVHFFPA